MGVVVRGHKVPTRAQVVDDCTTHHALCRRAFCIIYLVPLRRRAHAHGFVCLFVWSRAAARSTTKQLLEDAEILQPHSER